MEIHVRIPIRIKLSGEPGPDELALLTRRLSASIATRLARAERELAQRVGERPPAGRSGPATEVYDPARAGPAGYTVPSYDGAGTPTRVQVHRPEPEPWAVVRVVWARIPVDRILAFVAEVLGHPVGEAPLYEPLAATLRPAEVWLVRINRPAAPEEVGRQLLARADRPRTGERTEPMWALTASPTAVRTLAEADPEGVIDARIPEVPPGHAVFAFMPLPRIEVSDVAVLRSGISFTMPLRDAGFCIDPDAFAERTGLRWSQYADEYGEETVRVWLQPAVVPAKSGVIGAGGQLRREALFVLLDREASGGTPHRDPTARLFVEEEQSFPGLPQPVLQRAEWPAGAEGRRVLYARAYPDLTPERLGAAFFRPIARRLVEALTARLEDDPGGALETFLDQSGTLPGGHRLGSLFEYALDELDSSGSLAAVFEAADATRRFALRLRLLQLCTPTRYRSHPLVERLRRSLAAEREATTAHTYEPGGQGKGEIRLDRDPRLTVRAGQVLGEADGVYLKRVASLRPKPGRAEALRAQLLEQRRRMAEEILTGRDQREYDEREFAAEAVARAAQAAHVSRDDFEEIEVEHSLRLLEVRSAVSEGLPSFDVHVEPVWRVRGDGGEWRRTSEPVLEPVGEFEARLVYWRLAKAGELYQVIGAGVLLVGAVVVAWEAGVVALLVRLAGGARAMAVGIGLSEAEYLLRTILGGEKMTARGFLTAALDGYLMAVGFRVGGGLGRWGAGAVGTATARRKVISWVLEKLVTGAAGGVAGTALENFAHDIVTVTVDQGSFTGIQEYVRRMEFGAAFGIFAEFVVAPGLRGLASRAGPAMSKAALVAALLHGEGVTAEAWSRAAVEGADRMEQTLARTVGEAEARAWAGAMEERAAEVASHLGSGQPGGPPVPRTAAAGEKPPVGTPEPVLPPAPARGPLRPGPAARWPSKRRLEDAAKTDAEAELDRRWYESASEEQLRAREPWDPVATEYLDARRGGKRRPYQPDRPSDPAVQDALREDLRRERAAIEAERRRLEEEGLRQPSAGERAGWETRRTRAGRQEVPPTAKGAVGYQGTVAVARSDIPALAGERYSGGSPRALGSHDPTHRIGPPETVTVPQAHGHAEQSLGQQLDARLSRLTDAERAAARGRSVWIRVDQEVCTICAAGLGTGSRAGVLQRLSRLHPDILFEITADDTSTVYRLLGGRRVR
ncbi:hypothetical protein [Streptomyces sp. 891-h]|uniref:hypothetical protein n=1 Tax=Streptomyces sp. 891-h TaxID=2720714 RepID=UPI001FAA672A|nr:hypothetical protein [Streptomyces sp. 891-h]UNZ21174.1 hypothetical protein HC362_32955 [Streptomyces sp. 891-h]